MQLLGHRSWRIRIGYPADWPNGSFHLKGRPEGRPEHASKNLGACHYSLHIRDALLSGVIKPIKYFRERHMEEHR